jgi:anti-sigma B factor antagonist
MSIKADILRDAMGNIIVKMEGDLGFEHSLPLNKQLKELAAQNPNTDIAIDLGGLDFVGSSGICHFVESIHLLNSQDDVKSRISLTNVSDDFKKVIRLFEFSEADIIAGDFGMNDDSTEHISNRFAARKRTFEN